jgi:hypothetical protein
MARAQPVPSRYLVDIGQEASGIGVGRQVSSARSRANRTPPFHPATLAAGLAPSLVVVPIPSVKRPPAFSRGYAITGALSREVRDYILSRFPGENQPTPV